jgi:hypothetical protein
MDLQPRPLAVDPARLDGLSGRLSPATTRTTTQLP